MDNSRQEEEGRSPTAPSHIPTPPATQTQEQSVSLDKPFGFTDDEIVTVAVDKLTETLK
jgi:hypothetical protein